MALHLNRKKVLHCIAVIVISLLLVYLLYIIFFGWIGKTPCDQIGTSWATRDGRIRFVIVNEPSSMTKAKTGIDGPTNEDDTNWVHGLGTVTTDDGQMIEFVFISGLKGQMSISYLSKSSSLEPETVFEHGSLLCLSKDMSIIVFREESKLFESRVLCIKKQSINSDRLQISGSQE